jgi:AFG3 family protein
MENNSNNNQDNKPQLPRFNFWWLYVAFFVYFLIQWMTVGSTSEEISWLVFKNQMLDPGKVEKVEVVNREKAEVHIFKEYLGSGYFENIPTSKSGPHFYFVLGSVDNFEKSIEEANEKLNYPVEVKYVTRVNFLRDIIMWILPFIIIIAIWLFIIRRASGGMGGMGGGSGGMNPFDFGKSKANLFMPGSQIGVSFSDVAGHEEAKEELIEIVDFLKTPENYTRLGAKIPKGVILAGPPGTGKTLLARAIAGEAKVPFFNISGSEFVEMFVGVGASRVRDLFKNAKKKAPSIIFIDEIDAIGRARGGAMSFRSNDERESTLNQLLTEMDGFDANSGVIVIAATNRQDVLDSALLRPGRFDRHIYLELPNLTEREAIFKVHVRNLKLGTEINIEQLAAQTPGFSGADIANICNEAALIAARRKKDWIDKEDFNDAIDRIISGLEKKSKIITPDEKKRIAIHESGHATASWFLPNADTLMKVSIIPRGKSLGAAWYQPKENQLYTTEQFMDRICSMLAGRVAEDIFFEEVSSGALDDLEKVTKLAYNMVMYYGLNQKLGNISYYDSRGQYDQSLTKPYSEATAQLIDEEVRKLVDAAYQKTKSLLLQHKDKLEALAKRLLEKEIVFKEDLVEIFGERLIKDEE